MSEVKIQVRSQLDQVIEDLKKIREQASEVSEEMKESGKATSETIKDNLDRTKNSFEKFKGFMKSTAGQLKTDFKALASVQSLGAGLKLSEQFSGSIKETLKLNDAIRKLGPVFGIAAKEFGAFQAKMTKGLGGIGLSSEAAANALKGLSQTNVRGDDNLLEYSKSSGMLASTTGQAGSEGEIAKGMADLLKAQGADPNDMKQMQSLSENINKMFNATGKSATESLGAMSELYKKMDPDTFRKTVTQQGLTKLAASAMQAGPGATQFLEKYLSMDKISRTAIDQGLGFKGVVKDDGSIDTKKLGEFSKKMKGMTPTSMMSMGIAGMGEEEAKGFLMLAENLDKVAAAQKSVEESTAKLNQQYAESKGLGEAFRSSINRVKGLLGDVTGGASQGLTKLLGKASESNAGAIATVGGAAVLSAILTGKGLRGVGSALGSQASDKAYEAATGDKVMPVRVVNASEIGGGVGLPGAAGGGAMATAGKVLGVAALAYTAGKMTASAIEQYGGQMPGSGGKDVAWMKDNLGEGTANVYDQMGQFMAKLNNMVFGTNFNTGSQMPGQQTVKVELNDKDLREVRQPTRGSSF